MDSGRGITGGGSGYAAILAHAGGALYGMELGSVTLKRIGFFCFPIKHSTHTHTTEAQYSVISVLVRQETVTFLLFSNYTLNTHGCFPIKHSTHTWGGWTWAAMDSGSRITGGGSGYAAILAHAGGVLYGTELGSVT